MAKFKVIEKVPSIQESTYFVDAESEEEAIEMVQNGEVIESDYDVSDSGLEIDYSVTKL